MWKTMLGALLLVLIVPAVGMSPQTIKSPYQNPASRFDVNNDTQINTVDSELILAALKKVGPRQLTGVRSQFFYDVNGDGWISSVDALQVLKRLNP